MKKFEPCKGCTKETGRHAGCHATCPKFAAAAEQNKERREAERRDRIIFGYIVLLYEAKMPRETQEHFDLDFLGRRATE